jgi:hypothetical protein
MKKKQLYRVTVRYTGTKTFILDTTPLDSDDLGMIFYAPETIEQWTNPIHDDVSVELVSAELLQGDEL